MASGSLDNIEMLKALYDFTAVYPKTISFDEGEYFILYQTSARQRNWWQVVSMKGNIGFVPSNYVMKIKVEHDFLIGFLNSSIESLEKSSQTDINGIMSKNELLDRLREKKQTMERLYMDNTERDYDSSLSCSQSCSSEHNRSHRHQQLKYSPPVSKRLDMSKKSMSSPTVGANISPPQVIPESPSMGAISTPMQTTIVPVSVTVMGTSVPAPSAATSTPAAASASAAATTSSSANAQKVSEVAQDNSITSEPSEATTTTTTTTSEDVVTTYKETSQRDSSSAFVCVQQNGGSSIASGNGNNTATHIGNDNSINNINNEVNNSGDAGDAATASDTSVGGNGGCGDAAFISEQITDEKCATEEKSDASDTPSIDGCNGVGEFGEKSTNHSQALDSIESSVQHDLGGIGGYSQPNLKVESSDVYQIVDAIRRNTNLSFDMSCEALRVVLTSLEQLYNGAINPYLEAVAVHVTDKVATPKELLGITHDSKRLQYIFQQMAACKNDTEQRSWMLYEDEDDIVQFLEELVDILNNADETISCYEMSCDQYQMFINLVQYYQMETRWPIKRLLLKGFTAACHLDQVIVDILLTSVLPLEIVEDMKTHFSNLERFKELVKMLTIIFSLGQPMPVNHQDYLGVHFASFLLEIVEGDNPEVLVDMVIALILAFNQQFTDYNVNVIIEAMQNLPTAKAFLEKILLLLNRENDPTRLLKHANHNMNSVLKMFIDIFSVADTASMFYTNDSKVLIDILVRQLSDVEAGNPSRPCYLELCRRILRNTNYCEHQHRKHDLMKIFTRIFCEETECSASDQRLVREIANEFPQLFKA